MRPHLAAVLLTGLLGSGCATTLSSHQAAKPVEPGRFQVGGGMGLHAPLGAVGSAIGLGQRQAQKIITAISQKEEYHVTEEEQQDLLTAGIALAVLPPAPTTEVSIRTGLFENADIGLRYSVNAVRLDAKYRVFHQELDPPETPAGSRRSFDVAVGLAGARYLFDNPVVEALDFVRLGDFSRWDLELPVYAGWEFGDIARIYFGPKYLYSRTSFDARLVNTSGQASNITGLDLQLPEVVYMHFIGATAGVMVGYKYAFLVLELTGGYTLCDPIVLGLKRSLGGVTLFPSLGLALRF